LRATIRSQGIVAMATVEIYTSPLCGYCHAAKRLLTDKGVSFAEYDVMRTPEQTAGDAGPRQRAAHGAADLHRRSPCRRL
jgi:hypothetical protein